MEQFMYNSILDNSYIGIVTILDYEMPIQECLSKIFLNKKNVENKKLIVDLALKVGLTKYRFVSYNISEKGKVLINTSTYICPQEEIVKMANSFIRKNKELFSYSVLSYKMLNTLMSDND